MRIAHTHPERMLLAAILRRALFDYFSESPNQKAEATEWLFDANDRFGAFSFRWVCQHLDLDASRVRECVSRLTRARGLTTQQWWGMLPSQG